MSYLDDLEIKKQTSILHFQKHKGVEFAASMGALCQPNLIQNNLVVGELAGRAVRQVEGSDSKESRIYHSTAFSPVEDRLLNHAVNTTKSSPQK